MLKDKTMDDISTCIPIEDKPTPFVVKTYWLIGLVTTNQFNSINNSRRVSKVFELTTKITWV